MAGLFGGLAAQAAALPPIRPQMPQPQRRGMIGGSRPDFNSILTFLSQGTNGLDRNRTNAAAQRAAEQVRQQEAYADRIRSQLSPADGPMGSGTGAAPSLDQQEAVIADARLVNPAIADSFAPAVERQRRTQQGSALFGNDPRAQALYSSGNEEFMNSIAKQYAPETLAAGSVQVINGRPVVAAPRIERFDDRFGSQNPLTGETTFSAPRGPTYAEETQRNDPVNLAPGGRAINPVTGAVIAQAPDAYSLSPGEQRFEGGGLQAENTAPRPLPDAIRRDNERDEAAISDREGVISRVDNAIGLIQGGMINLDPASRASAWVRNNTGNSSPQSQALAELRRTVEGLRNSILNDATGPQTDGDSLRALNQIIQGWGDEQVVLQGLQAYRDIQSRKTDTQRSIMQNRATQVGGSPSGEASPQVIYDPQGRPYVVRNGQWVPQ